jgi:hypothetical protein
LKKLRKEITAHWPLINALASRRFTDITLAEEAALFVLDRLEENNCGRLREFSGKSRVSTYISSVSIRLLEDFSRKKFGRVRPPSWIQALGGMWNHLFQLLCLERFRVHDAVETVVSRGVFRDREEVETAAWSILERIVNCGKHQGLAVSFDDAEGNANSQDRIFSKLSEPEEQLLADERSTFFQLLFNETDESMGSPDHAHSFLGAIGAGAIVLNTEEQLLLKLCFQDGFTVTKAGKMLGLTTHQAHGKLRRLLIRLRQEFDKAGLSNDLRDLLQSD